ncbi:MAG: hypothetical protein ABJM86_04495 [Hyphomicrobiales bacterium]
MRKLILLSAVLGLFAQPTFAGEADVTAVDVEAAGSGKWRFNVTVRHADTGWEHYANGWEVVGPDGTVLGKRVLAHPHVEEQPFTRSGLIDIPADISKVTVRANDLVHGLGGAEIVVTLPK